MSPKLVHIGIDVSKLHLDIYDQNQNLRILNSKASINRWLKTLPTEAKLICESSGGYESLLLALLKHLTAVLNFKGVAIVFT